MILYDLRCQEGHGFEAWFRDGAAYDVQAANGEIACPVCGETRVMKAPMAPRIAKNLSDDRIPAPPTDPEAGRSDSRALMAEGVTRTQLEALRRHVEANCEGVGDRFAEEARRIHYGETPRRDIYGQATESEADELADEGVEFSRIPWPTRTDS